MRTVSNACWSSYGSRFAERILAPSERAAYRISSRPTWFLANRFAAKEALSKALGTGLRFPVTLHAISVESDSIGKPEFRFHGALPAYLDRTRRGALPFDSVTRKGAGMRDGGGGGLRP